MADRPFFTIFIPTFNRGYCIQDALLSCERSTFRDMEVLLIDDGSTDDTAAKVQEVVDRMSIPVRYEYQVNQGKHVAFNRAATLARGVLFLTLDSDDRLLEKGLQEIYDLWQSMSDEQHQAFASIEFRCLENGLASSAYPGAYFDSTYVEKRSLYETLGEKRSAYRVSVLRDYPYPVFDGERYCRPSMIDIRIAKKYKTRFSNIVAIDAGHYPDGIGANRRQVIASAPKAYRQYFLEEITDHARYLERSTLRSYYRRYSRSSFNAGVGASQQLREVPNKLRLLSLLPETFLSSAWDRLNRRKNRNPGIAEQ